MTDRFAIIEIGSGNTKLHVYEKDKVLFERITTIQFKRNYKKENKIIKSDLEKLYKVIEQTLEYTDNIHLYGCSIFRNITSEELNLINEDLYKRYYLRIEVVSQEDEANYTALGCYNNIDYDKTICIFINGGGSIELVFVKNKKVIDKKYYNFGVVDISNRFKSLKDDIPTVSFDEVYNYVDTLIGNIGINAEVLILAGGDHIYWYSNAKYELLDNALYTSSNQPYMLTIEMSDNYDRDTYKRSLDKIRNSSDNPTWFDGVRAVKALTNLISHKINAKFIIPTRINMEDGLKNQLIKN